MTQRKRCNRGVIRYCGLTLAAVFLICLSGCPDGAPPAAIDGSSADGGDISNPIRRQRNVPSIAGVRKVEPKVALPMPAAPPEPLHQPRVLMSDEHAQLCRVQVGDAMPAINLPDLSGNIRKLSDLYGDKLTVVVFWNDRKLFAREQFSRLALDTDHFREYGVKVVAINVGDPPEVVTQINGQYPGEFTSLLDARGEAFGSVAADKLPRTYVLDAEGRIIWLDIEFSRSTERELRNALYWNLLPEGERFLPVGRFVPATGSISG